MSDRASAEGATADRRSRVVRLLQTMETPVTVDRLVDELDAERPSRPASPGEPRSWEDLHERLHVEDLPALDRAGLLTFDPERGLVTSRGEGDAWRVADREHVRRRSTDGSAGASGSRGAWAVYYLVAAVLSALLLAGEVVALGPFAAVPSTAVAGAVVGLFGLLALLDVVVN